MQTIEIKPDVMVILSERAQQEGKAITEVLDEMLRSILPNGSQESTLKCHNCKNTVDYEISQNKGYCDYCESVVFIEKD
jgi:hypothetical protein